MESYDSQLGNKPGYSNKILQNVVQVRKPANPIQQELVTAREVLNENTMAAFLIYSSYNGRYQAHKMDWLNNYGDGQDNYTCTMAKELDALNWYQNPNTRHKEEEEEMEECLSCKQTKVLAGVENAAGGVNQGTLLETAHTSQTTETKTEKCT